MSFFPIARQASAQNQRSFCFHLPFLQITVEIKEEDRESFLELLHNATPACEVVSTRKVNGPSSNATKRPRFSVPATDEDQPRENVSVFERYRAQSHIPVPGPASPGEDQLEDLQNTTDTTGCEYCLQTRCITSSPFKPQARGNARINNHIKRRKDYKWYWRTLKDCGLWEDPVYQARKEQLGCHIDDAREVMPHCVIKDVRERWPNPPHVPYQGHRRA